MAVRNEEATRPLQPAHDRGDDGRAEPRSAKWGNPAGRGRPRRSPMPKHPGLGAVGVLLQVLPVPPSAAPPERRR